METVRYARVDERVELAHTGPIAIDPTPLLGTWINTNSVTPSISSVGITEHDGNLSITVQSASGPTPRDWGSAGVEVLYSNGVLSTAAMALTATYQFESLHVHLEGNLSLGLLVVATFNTFTDQSGGSNYFGREFFYRSKSRAH